MMADHVCSSFYKSGNNKLAITAVVLIKSSLQPHARIVFVNPDVPAAPVFTGCTPTERCRRHRFLPTPGLLFDHIDQRRRCATVILGFWPEKQTENVERNLLLQFGFNPNDFTIKSVN